MKCLIILAVLSLSANLAQAETRCGWIDNPTPANISLVDKDGAWTIGVQGGYQAEGDVNFPENDRESILTNPPHGSFCACLVGKFDRTNLRVIKITSSQIAPLSTCLRDRRLPPAYRPIKQIHTNGKAYTECQAPDSEEIIVFRGKRACVNEKGEYYFLAQ